MRVSGQKATQPPAMLSATNRLFYVSSVRPERPTNPLYLPAPAGGLAGVGQQLEATAAAATAPPVSATTVAQALSVLQHPKK